MWIVLAIASALGLGFYDIFKKLSVEKNNVLIVLFLNTLFSTLRIILKAFIVLSSWLLGYFGIKHLPLTIAGPINASRPVIVLVGALIIFGERLNLMQWIGVILGFWSLFFISRVGMKEGFSFKHSKWLWFSIGATFMGAVSALYDKYLLRQYEPLEVQAWYSLYQMIIMGVTIAILLRDKKSRTPFHWSWAIPCISIFLTGADIAYFYALSLPGSMIAVVSMIRRGSVIVSFFYGVMALHEKRIQLIGLTFLVLGSR